MKRSMRQSLSVIVGGMLFLSSPAFTQAPSPTVKQEVDGA